MKRVSFAFFWISIAAAQVVPDQFIVELAGAPAAERLARPGRKASRREMDDNRANVRRERQAIRAALELEAAEVLAEVDTVANALVVRIPAGRINRLSRIAGVRRIHPDLKYQLLLDHALPLHHIPEAWVQIGGIGNAGAGAKIGIIDTGIDIDHPAFQEPSLVVPDGYPRFSQDSDAAYTSTKIIVARSYRSSESARDRKGHGTSVAMIAAGATNTGPRGTITGVAPKAWLGSYKVFPDSDTGAPTSLILRALDDAVADGMDVINLSLGSVLAGRPAEDILVRAVERASDAGAIVVVAAGNTGPDPATISSPATSRSAIAVGNSMNDRVFAASAQAQGGPAFLAVPGSGRNSRLPISAALADVAVLDQTGLACQSLPAGSLQGRIALILRGECFFEEKLNFAEGAGAVAALIYTDASRPDLITMSVGNATLPAMMISNADGVRLKELLPSGAMVVSLQFTSGPVAVDANRLEGSSSRGPSADDNLKPDIVAVGTAIYTASPTSGADTSGYTVATGTSLSAPLVSGAAALLKAARPGLTAQQYRSLLINTSRTLDPAGPLPVRHTGAGVLDPVAALRATVTAFPSSIGFGSGASTVDLTRSLQLSNISKISDTFSITAIPIGAGPVPTIETPAVQISPGESINVSARFTAADLSPGEYQGFLEIAGTQNEVRTRIPYWYAVPSGIPRYITLLAEGTISGRSGAEQTFYFRISDASGLPVRVDPVVEATSGGGTVVGAGQDFRIPGAWAATVRLGSEIGRQTFMIRVGDLTREVAVQVTATTQLP